MSVAASPTICRFKGDDVDLVITLTNEDGSALNLTGFTSVTLLVGDRKKDPTAVDTLFTIVGTITDAAAGEVTFAYTEYEADVEAATYWYCMIIVDGSSKTKHTSPGTYSVLDHPASYLS